MSRQARDWQAIKAEYVTSEMSLRDLAAKLGLGESYIQEKAAKERWNEEREAYRSKTVAEAQQQAQVKEVSARVMILEAANRALEQWKTNPKADLQSLAKILELAARIEGLQLDKRELILKDWRDVGSERDTTGIQDFADGAAARYFALGGDGSNSEPGAGWTD